MVGKRCSLGKSCGATCIDRREECLIDFPLEVSNSLTKVRDNLEKKIDGDLKKRLTSFSPVKSEKEAIEWLDKNYKRLATEGMEEKYYGGPGQRGDIKSKVWMIGQEGYARPSRYYPEVDLEKINELLSNNPVQLVNSLKLQKEMHDAARTLAPKEVVTSGVEGFLDNKPFKFNTNEATVDNWSKYSGSTYYGKLGRILGNMGFKGNVLGANISSLMQPPGQQGSGEIAKMLKRNGVDPKRFAEGALQNKDSWYNYSARQRAPIIAKAIETLKPKLIYMGQQSVPDSNKGFNYLLYNLAKELKGTPYHINHDGKDYKYIVVDHGKSGKTVILNGWHPTAMGKMAVKVTDREFMQSLANSLMRTGSPQTGVVAYPIDVATMNKILEK